MCRSTRGREAAATTARVRKQLPQTPSATATAADSTAAAAAAAQEVARSRRSSRRSAAEAGATAAHLGSGYAASVVVADALCYADSMLPPLSAVVCAFTVGVT
jgi:hypothetical protein